MFRFSVYFRSHGLLSYSTAVHPISGDRKPPNFIVDFLINSLQFTKQDAIFLSSKGNITHLKSSINSELVIHTFKNYGLNNAQIKEIVFSVPKILTCKANKTLEPKIRVFYELGLSGSDLFSLIKRNPEVLRYNLHTRIIPYLNNLKRLMGSDEYVVQVINKSKRLYFTNSWMKRLSTNVSILQNYGLINPRITKFVLSEPEKLPRILTIILTNISLLKTYGLSDEKILNILVTNRPRMHTKPELVKSKLQYVEQKLGISCNSTNFIHGLVAVMYRSEAVIEKKRRVFRSFGWCDDEIATLIRAQPYCLNKSETNITDVLNFFMKELNYSASFLKGNTPFWTYSLEKRMKPRYEVFKILNERKLLIAPLKFSTILHYSEVKFIGFLKNFESYIPSLCVNYMNSITDSKAE